MGRESRLHSQWMDRGCVCALEAEAYRKEFYPFRGSLLLTWQSRKCEISLIPVKTLNQPFVFSWIICCKAFTRVEFFPSPLCCLSSFFLSSPTTLSEHPHTHIVEWVSGVRVGLDSLCKTYTQIEKFAFRNLHTLNKLSTDTCWRSGRTSASSPRTCIWRLECKAKEERTAACDWYVNLNADFLI